MAHLNIHTPNKRKLTCLLFCLLLCPIFLFSQDEDISKILWDANWSHDGKYIAVGGNIGEILIYDGNSFELLKRYPLEGTQRLRWHPFKPVLAVAALGQTSCLIQVQRDSIIPLKGIEEGTRAIAWHPDGTKLASATYEKSVCLWQENGSLMHIWPKRASKSFVGIDWHPNGLELICLSDSVQIMDLQGKVIHRFTHRAEDVLMLSVKWHPSAKFFVLGDYGNHDTQATPRLQFWKNDYSLQKAIKMPMAEIRNVSWNPKANRLATASAGLRIWSKKGKLLAEAPSRDFYWGVDWSPNGKYIITSTMDGNIYLYDHKAQPVRALKY